MRVNLTIPSKIFCYENVFNEIVLCLFQDVIQKEKINGGSLDIYQEDKILNIAYFDGQGVLIAQKNFNRKDIKLNEKS